jgi:hypothetical protein
MLFIIVGTKGKAVADPSGEKRITTCGQCGQSVILEPVRMKQYFSLFFVPLIPLNKGKPAYRCPQCKTLYARQEPSL